MYARRRIGHHSRPIVIKVPPPTIVVAPTPPVAQPTKPSSLSRIWSFAKVAGPALVAVAALAISLATYEDQHQANVDTASANLKRNAEDVSFSQEFKTPGQPIITVDNYSGSVISDAWMKGVETISTKIGNFSLAPLEFALGNIPACSTDTVNVLSYLRSGSASRNVQFQIEEMIFKDSNGTGWTVQSDGSLALNQNPYMDIVTSYVPISYQPSSSCL